MGPRPGNLRKNRRPSRRQQGDPRLPPRPPPRRAAEESGSLRPPTGPAREPPTSPLHRHHRACPGGPCLRQEWIAGTSPAMTSLFVDRRLNAHRVIPAKAGISASEPGFPAFGWHRRRGAIPTAAKSPPHDPATACRSSSHQGSQSPRSPSPPLPTRSPQHSAQKPAFSSGTADGCTQVAPSNPCRRASRAASAMASVSA